MVKVSVLGDWIYGIECHPKHRKTAVNKKIFSRSPVEIRSGSDCFTNQHGTIPNHYPNLLFDIGTGTYFVKVNSRWRCKSKMSPDVLSTPNSFPIKFESYGRRNIINVTLSCGLTKMAMREHTAGVKPLSNGSRTISPRTISPRTISPGQYPPGQYPPRTKSPRTISPCSNIPPDNIPPDYFFLIPVF